MRVYPGTASLLCLCLLAAAAPRSRALAVYASQTWQGPSNTTTTTPASGTGSLDGGGINAVTGDGGAGPTGASNENIYNPDGSGASTSTDVWEDGGPALGYGCDNGVAYKLDPIVNQGTPPGGFAEGWTLYSASGQRLDVQYSCPSVGSPGTPAVPPLSPPTPAEIVASTPFPRPSFGLNPSNLGLTGLASWFWASGVPPVLTSTASIRGYTTVTSAHPVKYYWYYGDGTSATSTVPGSAASPAVTHVYQTKNVYTLTLTVAWQGQYTFSGNGVPAQTVQLGTVDQAPATTTYRVQEIRSVLVTPN
jgi:hypothetical protein